MFAAAFQRGVRSLPLENVAKYPARCTPFLALELARRSCGSAVSPEAPPGAFGPVVIPLDRAPESGAAGGVFWIQCDGRARRDPPGLVVTTVPKVFTIIGAMAELEIIAHQRARDCRHESRPGARPAPGAARDATARRQRDRGARHLNRPQRPRHPTKNRGPGQPKHRRRDHQARPSHPASSLVTTFYTYPELDFPQFRLRGRGCPSAVAGRRRGFRRCLCLGGTWINPPDAIGRGGPRRLRR